MLDDAGAHGCEAISIRNFHRDFVVSRTWSRFVGMEEDFWTVKFDTYCGDLTMFSTVSSLLELVRDRLVVQVVRVSCDRSNVKFGIQDVSI